MLSRPNSISSIRNLLSEILSPVLSIRAPLARLILASSSAEHLKGFWWVAFFSAKTCGMGIIELSFKKMSLLFDQLKSCLEWSFMVKKMPQWLKI